MMTGHYLTHDDKPLRIVGYACLFSAPIMIGGKTEVIAPGAFSPTLRHGGDARATVDHRRAGTWASVRGGSLKLWEDNVGLAFSAAIPNTLDGRGLARAVADGEIGASILFRPFRRKETSTGYVVEAATLTDICLTTRPMYPTAVWLEPFESMKYGPDHVLALRRRWIGGQLKAKREARDQVTQPSVAPSHPARGAPSRAELAAAAYHEAKTRRPLHTRTGRRRAA